MINSSMYSLLFVLLLAACSPKRSGELSSSNKNSDDIPQPVKLVRDDVEKKVDVFINGKLFTSYLYPDTLKKPVLYPLEAANGTTITRGFPLDPRPGEGTDHPHHIGLWLNYGDVNGLDFWNNSGSVPPDKNHLYGTVLHRTINHISSGGSEGNLKVAMEWINSEGKALLKENTTFVFRGTNNKRIIDRITTLTALDEDVSMRDNKEGVLGIRMARELEHPDENDVATGLYRSSKGLEGKSVWGTRGKWMNLSGRMNNEHISVAILDHPGNTGYPTYWHARGYGLFAANPLGQKALSDGEEELDFKLVAGDSVTFKHRIIIYSGEPTSDEQVNTDWQKFTR